MAAKPPVLYRRIVIDYITGMGIFWTPIDPFDPDHSTRKAIRRFLKLRRDCIGLPDPFTFFEVVNKKKVDSLPVEFNSRELLELTHDVLFYGNYGVGNVTSTGKIIRWNCNGAVMPPLVDNWYLAPDDINNISGKEIGSDRVLLLMRRTRRQSS